MPHNSPFSNLPAEVHDIIFKTLDIKDVVSLSLTNGYFFTLAERHIYAAYMPFLGQWAGKHLMCVGDYMDVEDFPPWFSEEDKKLICRNIEDEFIPAYDTMRERARPVELYSALVEEMRVHLQHMKEPRIKDEEVREYVLNIICPPIKTFYPENEPWVLRDLTAKEFVRAEAIALKPEHVHGPDIDFRGFGEAVVSRICWSSDPSVSMRTSISIYRGIWAGHRFDITTLANHEAHTKQEKWKDVSKKIGKELDEIWSSEFGDDYRDTFGGMLTHWKVGTTRRAEALWNVHRWQ